MAAGELREKTTDLQLMAIREAIRESGCRHFAGVWDFRTPDFWASLGINREMIALVLIYEARVENPPRIFRSHEKTGEKLSAGIARWK